MKGMAEGSHFRITEKISNPLDTDTIIQITGHPYWPKNFSKAFTKIVRRAGLHCTLHGLRHTHASQLLRDGVPVQTVSARLGHANPSITLGVYAHLLPGMEQEAAMRTDEALKKALSE